MRKKAIVRGGASADTINIAANEAEIIEINSAMYDFCINHNTLTSFLFFPFIVININSTVYSSNVHMKKTGRVMKTKKHY